MVHFDVVAAFPHAGESSYCIYLHPPAEWQPIPTELAELGPAKDGDKVLWHMVNPLPD